MSPEFCGLAISKRGHDAGKIFLAYDKTERTVQLTDGKSRKLDNPKQKNLRHLRFLPDDDFKIVRGNLDNKLTDALLRRVIARYKADAENEQGGT